MNELNGRISYPPISQQGLQTHLLLSAFLAREFNAPFAAHGVGAIRRAAFSAFGFDARFALGDGQLLLFHCLANEALGFAAQILLRKTGCL